MRLAIVNDDMPFLVDSIAAAIGELDLDIDRVIHPVVRVTRDADGTMTDTIGGAGAPESMIYIELERADARDRRGLIEELTAVLADVRAAVTDWPQLQRAMARDEAALPQGEGAALLQWFLDGQFTLLGHQVWRRDGSARRGVGHRAQPAPVPMLAEATRALAIQWFEDGNEAPLLLKSSLISTVHRARAARPGRRADASMAARSPACRSMPACGPAPRSRAARATCRCCARGWPRWRRNSASIPSGHAGKALTHALTALPHDLVVAFPPPALEELALTAMSLADRPRPALVLVRSALGRHLFAFAWLPRDDLTTARRVAIGRCWPRRRTAPCSTGRSRSTTASSRCCATRSTCAATAACPRPSRSPSGCARMVRGWVSDVEAALAERVPAARAARLALRWAAAFPHNYRNVSSAGGGRRRHPAHRRARRSRCAPVRLFPAVPGEDRQLKIYKLGGALALSDAVPVLENFGFRVIGELPTRLRDGCAMPSSTISWWRPTPTRCRRRRRAGRRDRRGAGRRGGERRVQPADRRRRAVAAAVVLLRAWFRYLRQAGLPYGLTTVVDALRRAPE